MDSPSLVMYHPPECDLGCYSFLRPRNFGENRALPAGLQDAQFSQCDANHNQGCYVSLAYSHYGSPTNCITTTSERDHVPSPMQHEASSDESFFPVQITGLDITEVRREKSRDAARSRRGKENHEFLSLSRLLPLPSAITGQLDKASVIRLCISTLKLRKFARQGDPPWPVALPKLSTAEKRLLAQTSSKEYVEANFGANLLQAHDGFVLALSAEGHVLYISETVSVYLGLSQVELTGSSLFEYIHEEDRMELAEALNIPWDPAVIFQDLDPARLPSQEPSSDSEDGLIIGPLSTGLDRHHSVLNMDNSSHQKQASMPCGWKSCTYRVKSNYSIRFRSTLTKRGVQMKYSGYRVLSLQWCARLGSRMDWTEDIPTTCREDKEEVLVNHGFTMCATALPSLNMNELRMDQSTFTMKLKLDFKVIFCDPRAQDLLHYTLDAITNGSFYSLIYGPDQDLVCELHRDVLRKGQTLSSYYRVIGGAGGFFWLQTCAHLMAASKTPNDQCIVAVHTLLSNVQHEEVICGIPTATSSLATPKSKDGLSTDGKSETFRLPTCSVTPAEPLRAKPPHASAKKRKVSDGEKPLCTQTNTGHIRNMTTGKAREVKAVTMRRTLYSDASHDKVSLLAGSIENASSKPVVGGTNFEKSPRPTTK